MPPCAASDPRVFTGPKLKAGGWNSARGYDIFLLKMANPC